MRADITSGSLEPGTKLAVEHLRRRYGVGSSTIDWEAGIVASFHRLGKAQSALDEQVDGVAVEWESRNQRFHAATPAACGSRWVLHMLNTLHHHTERYRRLALTDGSIADHIQRATEVLATLYGRTMSG